MVEPSTASLILMMVSALRTPATKHASCAARAAARQASRDPSSTVSIGHTWCLIPVALIAAMAASTTGYGSSHNGSTSTPTVTVRDIVPDSFRLYQQYG